MYTLPIRLPNGVDIALDFREATYSDPDEYDGSVALGSPEASIAFIVYAVDSKATFQRAVNFVRLCVFCSCAQRNY